MRFENVIKICIFVFVYLKNCFLLYHIIIEQYFKIFEMIQNLCNVVILLILIYSGCKTSPMKEEKDSFEVKRNEMVDRQIISRGVKDANVIRAMRTVERHKFVLPELINRAYEDSPIPITEGQTISQPYIVALMTELLKVDNTKCILEIGTGSGYQAAVLAEIVDTVYTIEIFESLAEKARKIFDELNYDNIISKHGDGYLGWEKYAPFDGIIVTCSPSHVPEPLKEQLAEGGRIVIPVAQGLYGQELIVLEKHNNEIKQNSVIPVRFVPMIKEDGGNY